MVETRVFSGHVGDQAESLDRPANVELRNLNGLVLHWTDYVWTLRTIYAHTRANITYPPQLTDVINQQSLAGICTQVVNGQCAIADDEKTEFMGVGFSFDNGDWLLMSEVTRTEMDGYFQDTDSAYITLGRRIFDVTPYITPLRGSRAKTTRTGTAQPLPCWTHARGFGNTTGGLKGNQIALFRGQTAGTRWESTDVCTVRIDAAF